MEHAREPLEFALWNVCPETVAENVQSFERDTGIGVRMRVVDGAYHTVLGAAFAQGQGPEVFYAQRAEAALWGDSGFIAALEADHPALAPVLGQMDARFVAGARDVGGRLLGLTYYAGGPFALFLREGLEPPRTWRDFLNLMRSCKRDGLAQYPFVPRWHDTQTGLVWSLLCHLATEGALDLREAAAVDAVEQVLSLWSMMVAEDLVPPGSLDDTGDMPAVQRWASGEHCASFTMDYLAADAFALAGRAVGAPVALPGAVSTPLMPGHALLCLRAGLKGVRREEALALLAWLGGPQVHERWHRDHFFPVAYGNGGADIDRHAGLFPAAQAVTRIAADRARAVCSPVTQDHRALEWSAATDRLIRAVLRAPRADLRAVAMRVVDGWQR